MGKVIAVCISEKKGTQKHPVQEAEFIEDWASKMMHMPVNGTVRSVFCLMTRLRHSVHGAQR